MSTDHGPFLRVSNHLRGSDGAPVWPRVDAATSTMQTIDYEHHEIHSGSHYFVRGVQDLAVSNVLDFTWQMPNTTE